MLKQYSIAILAGLSFAALLGTSAQAALTISDKATSNVSCDAGVCGATAKQAVLNVSDLTTMLAAGNVAVESGDQANDITVDAAFSWTSKNSLTLTADKSITVNKAMADSGPAALTLSYGNKGDLRFGPKGDVSFTSTKNKLTINKKSYTLVDSIASMASAVAKKPSGLYALAHDYDASKDGTYSASPIATPLTGTFEGLGNIISKLSIALSAPADSYYLGFFETISSSGKVVDLGILSVSITIEKFKGNGFVIGLLAGWNSGLVERSYATGAIDSKKSGGAGGLIGMNDSTGIVERSSANVDVDFNKKSGLVGGLVFSNSGLINESFANGSIELVQTDSTAGGLVYSNYGTIDNTYSMGYVLANAGAGGLIGVAEGSEPKAENSYSTTQVISKYGPGGIIGWDSVAPSLSNTYWDLDTSGVSDPSQGAYDPHNDPGITGLTDIQLKSGLPAGFDSKIWAQDAKINNGYPYLKDNPPAK